MKNNNINLWLLIGIVIIVAVIASAITARITGNAISVKKPDSEVNKCITDCQKECLKLSSKDRALCKSKCKDSCPKYADVYTKDEVDYMMKAVSTNEFILNTLNKCVIYSVSKPDEKREVTGNEICEERNAGKCIFTVNYANLNNAVNNNGALDGSNAGIIESCAYGPYKSTEAVAYCCPYLEITK